jgi:plastocyanin
LLGWTLLTLSLIVAPDVATAETLRGVVSLVSSEGRQGRRLDQADAVVWLEPMGTGARTTGSPKPATMNQRKQMFAPHVLAVEVGTAVDFPNNDPFVHNVFSNFNGQVFDLQVYAPQTARRVVFRRPGIVHIFCNIHESMSAVIVALTTPYFTMTDGTGRFEIQAPAGEYRLQFWHERAQPEALARVAQRVTLTGGVVSLPDTQITISSQPLPSHKDKYGRDYTQRPEDNVPYQGALR